jgi:hypothetical protein
VCIWCVNHDAAVRYSEPDTDEFCADVPELRPGRYDFSRVAIALTVPHPAVNKSPAILVAEERNA